MAPEQIRGRRGDARTDVYAMGTLLYEMLTGQLPFEASNPAAVMRAKMDDRPTPAARHVRIDRALEATIMKAIERDPRDRHDSATELLEDLTLPAGAPRPVRADAKRAPRWWSARAVAVCVSVALGLVGVGLFL
jgi:serine/threonine-protein kinase